MNPSDLVFTAGWLVAFSWWMLGFDEWTDFYGDVDRARQERMGRLQIKKVKFIAWLGYYTLPVWGAGVGAILLIGFAIPEATNLAGILVGGVMWARSLGDEQEELPEVQQMRAALSDVVKDPENPPTVMLDGEHPDGGPLRAYIGGHPNFKEYTKPHRDALEHVIEYRLPGDWQVVDWFGDGSSIWERKVHPPTKIEYTRHLAKPWHQIPIGVDGRGELITLNLLQVPHTLIAGNTRNGKTSILRVAAAHILKQGVEVVAIDVKGGLAFLRGRKGVKRCDTRRIDRLTEGMRWVFNEISERCDLFDRDGTYRPPLVVFCDEVATACEWAGGKKSEFATLLLSSIRLAGQVRVFFILSTQRPAAGAIPIEVRGQAEGRVAVGPMEPEVAAMMFEREWARAVEIRKVKGATVVGDLSGQDLAEPQAFWMADPHDTDHDTDERDLADNLLPPVITAGTTVPDSGDSDRIKDLDKSRTDGSATAGSTRSAASTDSPTAETPYERYKRLKREGVARHRAEVRRQLRNPDCEWHGTKKGYEYGCRCDRCRAWYEMSKQKVPA